MQKSVTEIIEEVKEELCDNYCKYPEMYTADEWEENTERVCKECPLHRL